RQGGPGDRPRHRRPGAPYCDRARRPREPGQALRPGLIHSLDERARVRGDHLPLPPWRGKVGEAGRMPGTLARGETMERVVVIDDFHRAFGPTDAVRRLREGAEVTIYDEPFASEDALWAALQGVRCVTGNR